MKEHPQMFYSVSLSPALLANTFYKTGPSPFFIVHERFFKHRHMMPGVILSNRPITSIQMKVLEI